MYEVTTVASGYCWRAVRETFTGYALTTVTVDMTCATPDSIEAAMRHVPRFKDVEVMPVKVNGNEVSWRFRYV